MDQLSAHLDRGWDLAQKGDADGAYACAERALAVDPQSPEVHNLLGYAAMLRGEADEALEHYRHAIGLDDTYFEAMLNAAEVLVHPLGEWDDAIAMCDDAYELADTSEEIVECVLLKVDALLAKGETEGAKRAMKLLPDGPIESAGHMFMIGRAYYELGDVDRASPLIEEAARKDPDHPDVQYYLGLIRDEQGDVKGATDAFLRSRSLDLGQAPPPWSLAHEAFVTLVNGAVQKLDLILRRYVKDAEIYVTDMPGAELVVDGVDPRAPLLLDAPHAHGDGGSGAHGGGPQGSGIHVGTQSLGGHEHPPLRLFIYQRNVERAAQGPEAVEAEIVQALEREIASVFLEGTTPPSQDRHALN